MRRSTSKSLPILELLLTIALLLGPCLSMTGFMGVGSAHAHSAMPNSHAPDKAASQNHAHHGTQATAQSQNNTSHHPDPATSPPSCKELCENWAVQNSKKDLASTVFTMPTPGNDDASSNALIFDTAIVSLTGNLRRPPLITHQDVSLESLPAYARTNRFRL